MILQFKAMHSVLFSFTGGSACLKSTSNVGKSPTVYARVARNWKSHLKICVQHQSQNDWLTGTNGALCKLIWFHKASAVFYSWMHDTNKTKNRWDLDCRSHYSGFMCFNPLRCGRHSTGHPIKCSKISAGKHLVV